MGVEIKLQDEAPQAATGAAASGLLDSQPQITGIACAWVRPLASDFFRHHVRLCVAQS